MYLFCPNLHTILYIIIHHIPKNMTTNGLEYNRLTAGQGMGTNARASS